MSATRDGRGTRDVPLEMRKSVAAAIERTIASRYPGKSERVIAKALGISQPALNKLRRAGGALGVNALLELRKSLHISIDDLLGLPPLDDRIAFIHQALEQYEKQRPTTPVLTESKPDAPPAPRPSRPRRGVHE